MENFLKYANHVGLDEFKITWVKNVLGKKLKEMELPTEEVEHIIDFLASDDAPTRIGKMSFDQAKTAAEKWLKTQIKKGNAIEEYPEDTKTILDFGDGFKVVQLIGENAYRREGFLMSHCVAGYFGRDVEVYSLRDKENMPHCTMEKNKQIKGKGNGDIHPKYVGYVVKFLEHIGMTVGDSEMQHLGYINLEEFENEIEIKNLFNKKYHPRGQKIIDKKGEEFCDLKLWDKVPLVEFSSSIDIDFKINFDFPSFIKKSFDRLFEFSKSLKNDTENYRDKNYSKLAASGHSSKLATSGNYSKLEINGEDSVGVSAGINCMIKAKIGNWITLSEWTMDKKKDCWVPICVKSAQIDGKILKEDVFYKLVGGEFVEVLKS